VAKKTKLTEVAEKIGSAVGKADRTAHKVAGAAQIARKDLSNLAAQVEDLGRELKKMRKRLKRALS
jgi:HPt (histidine-containing phosphotransfer) domain-containing protein